MPMGHLGAGAACAGAGRMSIGRRSDAVEGRSLTAQWWTTSDAR